MLNDRLFVLLGMLDADELESVWVTHLDKKLDDRDFDKRTREQRVEPVSRELRYIAAHSISDLVRRRGDHDYAWKDILLQIADKLELKVDHRGDERAFEDALLARLTEESASHGKPSTISAASAAAKQAVDGLKSRTKWASYRRPLRLLQSIATARPIWGPNYKKLVPAVLFILSAARTHEAFNEAKS